MRVFTAALTVSLLAPLSTLSAQDPPPLEPGARVRVTGFSNGFGTIGNRERTGSSGREKRCSQLGRPDVLSAPAG